MTMFVPRLAAALLAAAALIVSAGAANARSEAAPASLHGFLLRADEPLRSSFPRTPAFAWQPVVGADHYEFQLSTSSTFRDNAIIWSKDDLLSPVAAPSVSLPWITGSPHSLYARVRAVQTDGTVGPWSVDYGFDVVPPAPPAPMPSAPGLLRWTPVEGADGYQVWLLDANKMEVTFSNVLDEREFYTFHQTAAWTGTVRWRVRALRDDMLGRKNGVPITQYGPWSSIYVSTNTPVSGGQIHLAQTLSDVVADGGPASPAHKLMPAFTWTGNETMTGTPAELFRVYVFTDKQCLNRVYTSAVVGGPAYAPRPFGPLALPTTSAGLAAARSAYLLDGSEPGGTTFDGEPVTTSESADPATPTTSLPLAATDGGSSSGSSSSSGSGDSSGSSGGGQSPPFLDWGDSKFGAPVDLWDTNWPDGGYYWTVVPVGAVSPGQLQTTIAAPGGIAGVTTLPVTNTDGFSAGDTVNVGNAGNQETVTIVSVSPGSLSFATGLKQSHGTGEPVVRTAGSIRYIDMELPQDVCAAGRVSRFGISSEPALTGGGDAFASGLSPSGQLTSATHTASFYRPPLVAWTPALRAEAYQVQWSKTSYPFVPEADPATGAAGILTGSTSYVLPLSTGTWYYRVRGYDYSLPTGAQQMSWSDSTKITIVGPTFEVVGGGSGAASVKKAKTASTRVYDEGSFSLALPKSWRKLALKDSRALFLAQAKTSVDGVRATLDVEAGGGRGSRTYAKWAKDLAAQARQVASGKVVATVVTEPTGKAIALRYPMKLKNGKRTAVYQWAFESGNQAYVLTCVAPAKAAKTYVKVFAAAARSFSVS
jgi:hypothetical protein